MWPCPQPGSTGNSRRERRLQNKIMTRKEALRILGLADSADPATIRRRYRKLISQVHPDALQGRAAQVERVFSDGSPLAEPEAADGGSPLAEPEAADGGSSLAEPEAAFGGPDARRVNQAYTVLLHTSASREGSAFRPCDDGNGLREDHGRWGAPLNEHAFCSRDVLCHAEDMEGESLGTFVIARGRYLWTAEEGFPLFLQSIYRCSRLLLEEAAGSGQAESGQTRSSHISGGQTEKKHTGSDERRLQIQGELAYLLAQQFIDARSMLPALAAQVSGTTHVSGTTQAAGTPQTSDMIQDPPVYEIPAMLELSPGRRMPAGETVLLPSSLRKHRLYLKNASGEELGYLSFRDDRLYYVVIPLFEQRRVQVKIHTCGTAGPQTSRASRSSASHAPVSRALSLQLRLLPDALASLPEDLNGQIRALLESFRRDC